MSSVSVCSVDVWLPACVSVSGAYDCAVISLEEESVQVQTAYLP